MSTNLGLGQAHESHFGPCSEQIDVADFLNATRTFGPRETRQTESSDADTGVQRVAEDNLRQAWSSLPPAQQDAVTRECRYVASIHSMQLDVCNVYLALLSVHRALFRSCLADERRRAYCLSKTCVGQRTASFVSTLGRICICARSIWSCTSSDHIVHAVPQPHALRRVVEHPLCRLALASIRDSPTAFTQPGSDNGSRMDANVISEQPGWSERISPRRTH